jgi:hypothetical protein
LKLNLNIDIVDRRGVSVGGRVVLDFHRLRRVFLIGKIFDL